MEIQQLLKLSFWTICGVVTCTYNPANLKAKFWNGVGSIPVGGNRPLIREWIV